MIVPDLLGQISIADGKLKSVTVVGDTTTLVIECVYAILRTIRFEDCLVLVHAMYDYDIGDVIISQNSEFYNATISRNYDDHEIGTDVTTKYHEVNIYGVWDDDPILTVIASEVSVE